MHLDAAKRKALPFIKMQGIGNDYVYVDGFKNKVDDPVELARLISHRQFGVGGDGLVLICPPDEPGQADARMRIFNADGSEAEMCGNAIRCVGKYVYESGIAEKSELRVETLAGVRVLGLAVENGVVRLVKVDMGHPGFECESIPMVCPSADKDFINRGIMAGGKAWKGTAVSMGNPHLVIPVDDVKSLDVPGIGPSFENHPLFPKRVNTEFVEVKSRDRVAMRVWERGSGETLACGTGACATLVACAVNGLTDKKAVVELLGGELLIEWTDEGSVFMTGGAEIVFTGEYFIPNS